MIPAESFSQWTERVTGWGVATKEGELLIRTVTDTRRAAILNWLISERQILVTRGFTDESIDALWREHSGITGATVEEIAVVRAAKARGEQ